MSFMKFALIGLMVSVSLAARAEETVGEKMKDDAHNAKVEMKKAGRKVKDETCEMVNGKMECAAKKAGHKVQNAVDDASKK